MNANNDNGMAMGLARHRFGGSLEAMTEGLMALLIGLVAVGAFVHEWHPTPAAPAASIAQHHSPTRAPRG